ncbi:MAG: hypothetical protein QGH12_11695, partial [SAR324 cluster bacterium]|nr:hypothetical protein [SAR324 cluster bacterium]
DPEGNAWDFCKLEMRQKARKPASEEKPLFLIGSPQCKPYSTWQALNNSSRDPETVRKERAAADVHLKFVTELYKDQVEGGRFFLHEHPAWADSWGVQCIQELMNMESVMTVIGDQCQYGQANDRDEPIRKATRWMSNSPAVLKQLSQRCLGRDRRCSRPKGGTHALCSGMTARRAAAYPLKLCKKILQGCHNQLRLEVRLQPGTVGIQPNFTVAEKERAETGEAEGLPMEELSLEHAPVELLNALRECNLTPQLLVDMCSPCPVLTNPVDMGEQFRDAITGQLLRPELVRAARMKELEYIRSKGVWEKRPIAEAFRRCGKSPISVRWIDVNKGDGENPNYRSRLVAREIRKKGENPI